jgi:hypothetical protein
VAVDLALRLTFRNFATLFLAVAIVTVPLHVAHAFLFRDVYAVRDIQEDIARLEPNQPVREVTPRDIDTYNTTAILITAAEIALIPLLVGATRHVLATDSRSELPRVGRAWAHSLTGWRESAGAQGDVGAVVVGFVLAVVVALMVDRIGTVAAEPVPDGVAFGPLGLSRGLALALGAPFFFVPLALFARKAKARDSSADSLASPDN